MRDIFNLAYLRIKRKWKTSLLFFLVLLLSFSSAIVSVSIVGSIDHTNAEYRLNTYGEWYFAIPYGYDGDKEWISEKEWTESLGTAQSFGAIPLSDGFIGFGTIDQTLIDIGRIRLDQGALPSSDDEIAMEADSLSALGYDYTLGQKISVAITVPSEKNDIQSPNNEDDTAIDFTIERTYVLCGIIHEYSDLWFLENNKSSQVLNSAVVTEASAAGVLEEANQMLAKDGGISICAPIPQYYISVSEENRIAAGEQLKSYFEATRTNGKGDGAVSVNSVAYPNITTENHDDFYVYLIAILTFISILCLGIIQLPTDTHSFSVLRSVGMSKGQLGMLQLFETVLFGLPAFLLGIPLGATLTWISLRLMLYSGSVPVQVYIPYEMLYFILVLWLTAIFISRLVIFVLTLHIPMIGRLQINTPKSRCARLVRNGFIVLLLCVFSVSVIFTGMESVSPEYKRGYWSSCPSYVLWKNNDTTLSQSDIDALEGIPGISDIYGFSELYIGLSFDGMSEETVYLFAIDENDWTDIFDLGSEKTAFHNGEIVLISVPDDGNQYPLPKGEAVLHFYNDGKNKKLLASDTVAARVRYLPENVYDRTVACLIEPYTVVCSEQFVRNLLKTLPEDEKWGKFSVGEEFGYGRVFITADLNSDDLSTDITLARICSERNIWLSNNRQQFLAHVQENVQSLIMLYFSGVCICIIALMILWSNVSLEEKNENRSFLIKRCIGMSKRQIYFNVLGKTCLRCLSAFFIGWLIYIPWKVLSLMSISEDMDLITALDSAIYGLKYDGCTINRIIIISFVCLAVPLIMILFAKKNMGKDGDIK